MRKLLAIGAVGAVVGYAVVHFALGNKPAPAPQPEEPAATAEPQLAEPVVLSHVVEVTPIDNLLDPPKVEPTGEPFDSPDSTFPVNANSPPTTPIPPAGD